jgi:hypothetical protein
MKKILILLLVCSIANSAFAQKFSLGIKAGGNYCTGPLGLKGASYLGNDQFSDVSGNTKFTIGFKAAIDIKILQAGIGFDYGKLGYTYSVSYGTTSSKYSVTEPYLMPYVFVNLKTRLPRSYLYYGVNLGYINLRLNKAEYTMTSTFPFAPAKFKGKDPYAAKHATINYGAQLGYNFHIVKGLSAGAEVALRYIPLDASVTVHDINGVAYAVTDDKGMLTIPFTLGVNYTFGK